MQQYRNELSGYNEITITARFDATVTVTSLVMIDIIDSKSIQAGKVFTFKVSGAFRMEGTRVERKGIEIKSTADIAVIGANYVYRTSDAFLALPSETLGQTYVVATRFNANLVNVEIISQHEGTKVTITLKTKGYLSYLGLNYANGQSFTITLAKLETFHLMHNKDLSGTIITSSYPISVLSGSRCETAGYHYCDHLVSFLLPVTKWGKEYILAPAMQFKSTGDFYRVFAFQETMVKSRNLTANLCRGEYLEIDLKQNELSSFVSCSKPCQVVQYLESEVINKGPDPSSISLPSTEQFASSYKVIPLMKPNITAHHITILIEEKNKDALMLSKARNVEMNWQKVNETKYVWGIHNISTATNVESFNGEKFGLIVAGYELSGRTS